MMRDVFAHAQGTAGARHCGRAFFFSRKDCIAQAEKNWPGQRVSAGLPNLKGAALGKFPGREITSAISQKDVFSMVSRYRFAPRYICAGLVNIIHSGTLGGEICAGILARRVG